VPAASGDAGAVRTGLILPSFSDKPDLALAVARLAEDAGVDGVFCYDHLWPMGRPDRPALAPFPLLGAVAVSTDRVAVGTLVARVGLVPDEVLMAEVEALSLLAPGRVVIALGTGDRLSAQENEAYGVSFADAAHRRASLRWCTRLLREQGVPVWIGGGSPRTVAVAEEEGAAVNLWAVPPELVTLQAQRSEVTWAGPAPGSTAGVGTLMKELNEAGATWVVFAWPMPIPAVGSLREWSSAGSTGCRPMSSPPSTT